MQKAYLAILYFCTGIAIAFTLLRDSQDVSLSIRSLLVPFFAACCLWLFLNSYSRFLLDSVSGRKRSIRAAIWSASAVFGAAICVYRDPFRWTPGTEESLVVPIFVLVIALSVFVVASLALLVNHRLSFALGTAAIVTLVACLGLGIAETPMMDFGPFGRLLLFAAFIAATGFVFASALVLKNKSCHFVGLFAAFLAWPWFVLMASILRASHLNPWIALNLPDYFGEIVLYTEFDIIATVLLVFASVGILFRLCPERWGFRGVLLRDRSWLMLAVSGGLITVWFIASVIPYTVPSGFHHGSIEIEVWHVEKSGFRFRETRLGVQRDGRLIIQDYDRRPFRFHSDGTRFSGVISGESYQRVRALTAGFKSSALPMWQIERLHGWESDNWYIYVNGKGVLFSSAQKTTPPGEIVDWFRETTALGTYGVKADGPKDVCLGFCYDPIH